MRYTLFSIDNPTASVVAQFFATFNATPGTQGNLIQCLGKWNNEPQETSFCALSHDFDLMHSHHPQYFRKQSAVLRVSENNNQEAFIEWLYRPCTVERLGVLRAVDQQTALKHQGWTYRPDLNQYWIIDVKADDEQRRAAYDAWFALKDYLKGSYQEKAAQNLAKTFGFQEAKQVKFTMHPIPGSTGFTIRENSNA